MYQERGHAPHQDYVTGLQKVAYVSEASQGLASGVVPDRMMALQGGRTSSADSEESACSSSGDSEEHRRRVQHFMAAAPLLAAAALATQASLLGRRARLAGSWASAGRPGSQSKPAAGSPRTVATPAVEQARPALEVEARGPLPAPGSHQGMAGAGRAGPCSPFNLSRCQAAAALKVGLHPNRIWHGLSM